MSGKSPYELQQEAREQNRENAADKYERLQQALTRLMTPSQRAQFRANKTDDDAAIIAFVTELVVDRQNLQTAVDTTLEDLRKVVYDLGNA